MNWEWIRKKAEGSILAHERRLEKIRAFINAAEWTLKDGDE